jgi:hypothetical protein
MDRSPTRAKSLALLRLLAEEAERSASQRAQDDAALTRQLLALRIYRDGDPVVLASAMAEQTARTKLADQARAGRARAERSGR